MKKQDLAGLEGKALELATAFNNAVEKIGELEAKSSSIDALKVEIASLKDNAKGTELEAKMTQLSTDFASRVNELEGKMNKGNQEIKTLDTYLVEQKSQIQKVIEKDTKGVELDIKADYRRVWFELAALRAPDLFPVSFV